MSFNLTIHDYPHYTYKDYEIWEGDWELIKGIPYAMAPAPVWQHQSSGGKFVKAFLDALDKQTSSCKCEVLYESDWIVSDDTVVCPDVMIVCEPISGNFVTAPPALILEILSPSSIMKDRNTKFKLYQACGVHYYLMADIGKKKVEVFHLKDNLYQEVATPGKFQLTKDCTINVPVHDILS
ncbi:MAG TPA: Uma2 family endonuclease [Flavisolibacter sp.]|jgi:Uma2 family endonuclease|nr:Uma2 family endonuclease [Flavisolibacter sp.]